MGCDGLLSVRVACSRLQQCSDNHRRDARFGPFDPALRIRAEGEPFDPDDAAFAALAKREHGIVVALSGVSGAVLAEGLDPLDESADGAVVRRLERRRHFVIRKIVCRNGAGGRTDRRRGRLPIHSRRCCIAIGSGKAAISDAQSFEQVLRLLGKVAPQAQEAPGPDRQARDHRFPVLDR